MTSPTNPTLLVTAVVFLLFILLIGQLCSCCTSASHTSDTWSKKLTSLQERLEKYETLNEEERKKLQEEYDHFTSQSDKTFLSFGVKTAFETEGEIINNSKTAALWKAFINESYIGKFFTQEIVTTPIQSLLDVIKWMTAFLATEYMKRWITEHTDASELYSQVLTSLVIFIVVCDAYLAIIRSYIRSYQTDLIQGKDYDK